MTLGQQTPEERQIIQTFARHLAKYCENAQSMGAAAHDGESPKFAEHIQSPLDAAKDASPEEISWLLAAVTPAVVATVMDFLESNGPLETS